jgi:hypothetical protein
MKIAFRGLPDGVRPDLPRKEARVRGGLLRRDLQSEAAP